MVTCVQAQSHAEDVQMRRPGEGSSRAAMAVSDGPTAILQRPSSAAAAPSGVHSVLQLQCIVFVPETFLLLPNAKHLAILLWSNL